MKSLVITSACALFLLVGCLEPQRHLEGDADLDDAELGDADLELDGALEDAAPVEDADLVDDADEIVSPDGDEEPDIDEEPDADEELPLPSSCLEILRDDPSSPSGVYEVQAPDGPINVFCEMELSGGGWTALINPDLPGLEPKHRWLSVSADILSGEGEAGCGPTIIHDVAGSWNRYSTYACGTHTIRLNLAFESMPEIRDVMFTATAQGRETHHVEINGHIIETTLTEDGCYFWNCVNLVTHPAVNECWSTTIDVPPYLVLDAIRSPILDMGIVTGPSGSPSWSYGTGSNITRLFVR